MSKNKSAEKRLRQNLKRRARNRMYKSMIKTALKKLTKAMENNEIDRIEPLFKNALREINKAKSKGIIHRNTASREISRLYKKTNQFLAGIQAGEEAKES